eukprot:6535125-Ditylum_brightwellii.AAC.1
MGPAEGAEEEGADAGLEAVGGCVDGAPEIAETLVAEEERCRIEGCVLVAAGAGMEGMPRAEVAGGGAVGAEAMPGLFAVFFLGGIE